MEAAREGAGFGGPATAAVAAFEGVGAEGGEAEVVNAVIEAVEGLADSETEAAGAAGEAVSSVSRWVRPWSAGVGAREGVGECEGELRMIIGVYSLDTERL